MTLDVPLDGGTALAIVKPEAIRRSLAREFEAVFARVKLRVTLRRRIHLSRSLVMRLARPSSREAEPIKFEVNCAYLTEGPCEAWMLRGDDAIRTSLGVKAYVRHAYAANEVFSLLHTADSVSELQLQAPVVFGHDIRGDEEPACNQLEAAVQSLHWMDGASLERMIADLIEMRPAALTAPGAGSNFALEVRDDTIHSIDGFVAALADCFPDLERRTTIRLGYDIKAHGRAIVGCQSIAHAGAAYERMRSGHRCDVHVLPPTSLGWCDDRS